MNPTEALYRHPKLPLWRYTRSDDQFRVSNMNTLPFRKVACTPHPASGQVGSEPEWLGNVLAVARVGGHMHKIFSPPPQEVLWFVTDLDGSLVTFLELL